MKTGVERIAEERLRQIEEEGWNDEYDDSHENGELAQAAAAYAIPDVVTTSDDGIIINRVVLFPYYWSLTWWKPTPDNRIRELEKAGALIAAEIDRLQRLASKEK